MTENSFSLLKIILKNRLRFIFPVKGKPFHFRCLDSKWRPVKTKSCEFIYSLKRSLESVNFHKWADPIIVLGYEFETTVSHYSQNRYMIVFLGLYVSDSFPIMSVVMEKPVNPNEKTFSYSFVDSNKKQEITVPVKIPMEESATEFVHRVMKNYMVPCYFFDDIYGKMQKFIERETVKYHDDVAEKEIEEFKKNDFDVDSVVKYWEKLFKNETTEYSDPVGTTDEELFSVVYHKLVHSPALEMILQKEQAYAISAGAIAEKRRKQISNLSERQNDEMSVAVQELHLLVNESEIRVTEKDINDLAAKHFEEQCLASGRLNSEVEALHQSQKKEYRSWLMAMFEKQTVAPTPLSSPVFVRTSETASAHQNQGQEPWPILEESFTIHLGSQMKQMHNVRILSANVLDFCRIKLDGGTQVDPQRIETALALYSTSLSGIVLLVDLGSFDGFTGLAKDFVDVCQQTTEFHFANIDNQLEAIKAEVKEAVAWRSHKSKSNPSYQVKRSGSTKNLQAGDLYITKHSNLSQTHVVFHLLVDDTVKSNDMNSRHPVILGLRNVLKTAASYDITTITLPLLLTNEMTEEMTVAWCSKRAELVFKCVKGFMIEAAGVGGAEINNLQFLVPAGISPEVFSTLATMLPSIFRVSNPLVVKAGSQKSN